MITIPMATIIAAVLLFLSSIYQTWNLNRVHKLVNSNFTEAKQARLAAEKALKIAQDLNTSLRNELNEIKLKSPKPRIKK